MPDTTGIVVVGWIVGIVGVGYGLLVAATGRARLLRGFGTVRGPAVRVAGIGCALAAALLAWYILTNPVVTG